MDKMNLLLRNIQISLQILLWIFLFYSLDFDLFTYMFNDKIIIKSIFGIGLMLIQLYLFQNLYNLVEIDSVYINDNDKELENISEKHDYTSCKKFCNKCILEMDHHCFSLNKCIGKNNYAIYIKYLIFVELNTSLLFGSSLYVCYNYYSQLSMYYLIKYALISIASFLCSATLYLYLIFLAYLYLSNLTTLEFLYPKLRLTSQNLTQ